MPPRRKLKKTRKPPSISKEALLDIWSICLVSLGLFVVLSVYFNLCGVVGSYLKNFLLGLFGNTCYILPLVMIYIGISACVKKGNGIYLHKNIILFLAIVSIAALYNLFDANSVDTINLLYAYGKEHIGGGFFGGSVCMLFVSAFGTVGTGIFLFALLLILFIVYTDFALLKSAAIYFSGVSERIREASMDANHDYLRRREDKKYENHAERRRKEDKPAKKDKKEDKKEDKKPKEKTETYAVGDVLPDSDDFEPQIRIYNPNNSDLEEIEELKTTDNDFEADEPLLEDILSSDMAANADTEPSDAVVDDIGQMEIEYEKIDYNFPPVNLLNRNQFKGGFEGDPEELRKDAKKLTDTLKSFGVDAKVVEVTKGPSVTRFELSPGEGVKVSKITSLSDDIALNLAAYGVRIEAPIPGKAAIGIEVSNKSASMVLLRDVVDTETFAQFPSKLGFALGKDIEGRPIIADIAKMPHLLIAGATGSGKSVCINTLITSILYKADPNDVKLILIDPKVVELGVYNGIPHLLIPVVTDPRKAAGALHWAVTEMVKRYKLFAENNVRDISGYNQALAENDENRRAPMPQIVIIIDELADLMMVAPNDVEDSICRLAQMARAAGMHLVIATQRPSVDVITGVIKANVPSRISFSVSSQVDSRTILDMTGAEKLLGKGDMLYLPIGASKPIRVQGPFVSDKEVEAIVDYVKINQQANYDLNIIEKLDYQQDNAGADTGENDELLSRSIEIAVEAGQVSVSLIQRKLKVGYARAGRLVDQMEKRGVVGPFEGSKPRQVLINRQQMYEMQKNL